MDLYQPKIAQKHSLFIYIYIYIYIYNVADVTVRNLNQIMKTVMTYLIVAIKELVFVWCVVL